MKTLQAFPSPFSSLDDIPLDRPIDEAGAGVLAMADGSTAPHTIATCVRCYWNENALFVLFSGRFVTLRVAPATDGAANMGNTFQLWEKNDVYEVFVGADAMRTRRYAEFQVAPDGRWLDTRVDASGSHIMSEMARESDVRCASHVSESHRVWRAALQIPWAGLESEHRPERVWHCNFYRATGRYHGDELLAWSPTGFGNNYFHRPEKFGALEIVR